jgi:hypothetical protein
MIPPQIVARRQVLSQAISATNIGANGLLDLALPVNRLAVSRLLYFGVVLDEVADFTVAGSIDFTLYGNQVTSIPVYVNHFGCGRYNTAAPDVVLPVWSCTRRPLGTANVDADNFTMIPRDLGAATLQSGWTYSDGTNNYDYTLLMSPLPLRGEFDQVIWKPATWYGTGTGTTALCAVVLACRSDGEEATP